MIMTVEQISRILNKLNICFTVNSAIRLINNKLIKVPRPKTYYNTGYAFLVDVQSLERYLINECKLDTNKTNTIIYGS